jgi:alpha-glucosidase (family GH31 glycosyl hydrolase)
MGPEMNYVGEKPFDPITFNIYPDEKGAASTTLYEDDGLSPSYKQDGFRRTVVNAAKALRGFTVTVSAPQGLYNPGSRKFSFVIKSDRAPTTTVMTTDDGSTRNLKIQ